MDRPRSAQWKTTFIRLGYGCKEKNEPENLPIDRSLLAELTTKNRGMPNVMQKFNPGEMERFCRPKEKRLPLKEDVFIGGAITTYLIYWSRK